VAVSIVAASVMTGRCRQRRGSAELDRSVGWRRGAPFGTGLSAAAPGDLIRAWAPDGRRRPVSPVSRDLYVPHRSKLGTVLELRVEQLAYHTEVVDGYRVLSTAAQIAAKWAALIDRAHTTRGQKDRSELLELLKHRDAGQAASIIREVSAKPPAVVDQALRDGFTYLYAAAPKAQRSQLRRLQNTWTQPSPVPRRDTTGRNPDTRAF
jgi:hypothetical protein